MVEFKLETAKIEYDDNRKYTLSYLTRRPKSKEIVVKFSRVNKSETAYLRFAEVVGCEADIKNSLLLSRVLERAMEDILHVDSEIVDSHSGKYVFSVP